MIIVSKMLAQVVSVGWQCEIWSLLKMMFAAMRYAVVAIPERTAVVKPTISRPCAA